MKKIFCLCLTGVYFFIGCTSTQKVEKIPTIVECSNNDNKEEGKAILINHISLVPYQSNKVIVTGVGDQLQSIEGTEYNLMIGSDNSIFCFKTIKNTISYYVKSAQTMTYKFYSTKNNITIIYLPQIEIKINSIKNISNEKNSQIEFLVRTEKDSDSVTQSDLECSVFALIKGNEDKAVLSYRMRLGESYKLNWEKLNSQEIRFCSNTIKQYEDLLQQRKNIIKKI